MLVKITVDKKIVKNYIYNSIYQILLIIMPLVTTPYLSRVLGTEGIGESSYYYSIAYYFSIFTLLGLNNYGNRKIAMVSDDIDARSKEFFSLYTMQLIIGLVILCLYILYCSFFSGNSEISRIYIVFVLASVLDINWFFFGLEKFNITVTRNIVVKILSTICIFVFVNSPNDVQNYCFIISISMLLNQILLWPFLKRYVYYYKPDVKEIVAHIKPNFLLFLSVLGTSLYKYMDKIMIGKFSTMTEVGYYEQAEKIIALPTAFIVSLGTIMLPRVTNLISKSLNDIFKEYFKKSIILAIFLSSSISFGIMSVSKEFVPLFYGSGNEKIIILFKILLPSCIFLGIGNVITTQYLIPKSKDIIYIKSIFFGAIVNVVFNSIFIHKLGSIGAAFGTLITEFVVCVYKIHYSKKELDIIPCITKSIVFIFIGVFMYFILDLFNGTGDLLHTLILKILVGVIFYFSSVVIVYIFYKKFREE